jgi:hypothetical protein
MIFTAAIDTPANTTQSAPVVTEIPIVLGTITRVMILFPAGVSGLAHLKILWGLYQIFPSSPSADFTGDAVLIEWDENTAIDADPAQLTAITWNLDDTYDHTITLHVVMQPFAGAPNAAGTIAQLMAPTPASSS